MHLRIAKNPFSLFIGLVAVVVVGVLAMSLVGGVAVIQPQTAPNASSTSPGFPFGMYLSHPMIRASTGPLTSAITAAASFNWGGYAVSSSAGVVTSVSGTWIVPKDAESTCPTTAWHSSSTWVGIDGLSSNTVEQIGTSSQCYEGSVQYFAWYEFYPSASVVISSVPVSPGNKITASVTYSSGLFTVSIKDVTTGGTFSTSVSVPGATESSAEWIIESPFGAIGELPLVHFSTVKFTSASATIGGTTGSIGSFANVYSLTMVDFPAGTPTKATVTALSSSGSAFSVKWVSAGPYG
jgi:hypothetical protein